MNTKFNSYCSSSPTSPSPPPGTAVLDLLNQHSDGFPRGKNIFGIKLNLARSVSFPCFRFVLKDLKILASFFSLESPYCTVSYGRLCQPHLESASVFQNMLTRDHFYTSSVSWVIVLNIFSKKKKSFPTAFMRDSSVDSRYI